MVSRYFKNRVLKWPDNHKVGAQILIGSLGCFETTGWGRVRGAIRKVGQMSSTSFALPRTLREAGGTEENRRDFSSEPPDHVWTCCRRAGRTTARRASVHAVVQVGDRMSSMILNAADRSQDGVVLARIFYALRTDRRLNLGPGLVEFRPRRDLVPCESRFHVLFCCAPNLLPQKAHFGILEKGVGGSTRIQRCVTIWRGFDARPSRAAL